MPASVLVAYATKYGSTKEVAEAIAATLRELGLEVDIRPAREVRSLESTRAIVLGAPLYMFRWHKDALRFLSRHRKALATRPAAIFALGPAFKGDEEEFRGAREQLDRALARFPWLAPADVKILGGKLDAANMKGPQKLFMKAVPAADLRDWDAIRAWASGLPAVLHVEP